MKDESHDPRGNTTRTDYNDAAYTVTTTTESDQQYTIQTFDLLGREVRLDAPPAQSGGNRVVTVIEYNDDCDEKTVTDPQGRDTVYAYDGQHNLIRVADPTTTTTYTYDGDGNRTGNGKGPFQGKAESEAVGGRFDWRELAAEKANPRICRKKRYPAILCAT